MEKMEYKEILKFIDNISTYSDEYILNNFDYIEWYLNSIGKYEIKRKFLMLAIKSIRNLDKKLELILRYYHFHSNNYHHYEWKYIISILENSSEKNNIKLFKQIFNNIKFNKMKKCLNIPENLKFGVELEYAYVFLDDIKKLFENKMIIQIMKSISIPQNLINSIIENMDFEKEQEFNKWIFSKENNTGDLPEASSPIMTNTLDNINQINGICTLFNALGAQTHGGTGLHINIGADYFENNIGALKYLLIIWGECEELFFKIANEENDIIRVFAINMAKPIKENIQKTFEENFDIKLENEEDFTRFLYNIQVRDRLKFLFGFNHGDLEFELMRAKNEEDKYYIFKKYLEEKSKNDTSIRYTSINFNHMTWNNNDKGRIEFRLFNSTLSIDIIMQNLLLIGKLFEVSLKLSNNDKDKLIKFSKLLNHNVTERKKLDLLLDLLFDNEEEKQIFRLRWISIKDNHQYDKFKTGNKTNGKGRKSYCLKK